MASTGAAVIGALIGGVVVALILLRQGSGAKAPEHASLDAPDPLVIAMTEAADATDLALLRVEDGHIIWANEAAARLACVSPESLIGQKLVEGLIPESHLEAMEQVLSQARRTPKTARIPWNAADGTRRLVEWRAAPVGATPSSTVLLAGRDRTEELHSEREMATLRAQASTALLAGPFGIATLDRDGELLDVSEGARTMFGATWDPGAVPKLNLRACAGCIELASAIGSALRGKAARTAVTTVPGLGPRTGWFQIDVVPVARSTGELLGVTLVCQDQTAQREAEEAIHESDERLRFLMETLREMVVVVQDGRFTYVSEGCRRLLGREPHEVTDKSLMSAIVPEHRERLRHALMQGMRAGVTNIGSHELQVVRKSGQRIWVELRPQITTWKGRTAIVGVMSDITKRREADERLRFQGTILEHLTEWVVVTDPSGRLTWVSPSFERSYGRQAADIVGHDVADAFGDLKIRDGRLDDIAREAVARGHWGGNITIDTKTSGPLVVDVGVTPMRNLAGELTALIAVARDVTAQMTLETQLRQAQKMEAIGQLAGGIAHDFNNILVAIKGYAQLAGAALPVESPIRADLEQIDDASRRAAELTRQLLAFGRREPSTPKIVDLNDAVIAFAPMLQRMVGEHVRLDLEITASTATVRIDANQVELALMNLVANARDALDGGGKVILRTETMEYDGSSLLPHPMATPGSHVVVSVVDHGSGMPAEVRDKVFEPFFTTKELGRGTGLGLSTVYGIVSQNGGFIELQSAVGEGTTFRMVFPVVQEQPARKPEGVALTTTGGAETVLIAEDEPPVLRLARRVLSNAGYQVLTATNGREAVDLFRAQQHAIGLVILDVVMPEMGGRRALEEIRKLRHDVPALFCSGYSIGEIDTNFLGSEGVHLLNKPYSPADLLARARALLDDHRSALEAAASAESDVRGERGNGGTTPTTESHQPARLP